MASYGLTSISKKRNYFKKSVNIEITGYGFLGDPTSIQLIKNDDSTITIDAATTDWTINSTTKATVKFRLIGARRGLYDLVMMYGAFEGRVERAFRIQ
jgi:hypothetical protein